MSYKEKVLFKGRRMLTCPGLRAEGNGKWEWKAQCFSAHAGIGLVRSPAGWLALAYLITTVLAVAGLRPNTKDRRTELESLLEQQQSTPVVS